jgi:hypothetical protein
MQIKYTPKYVTDTINVPSLRQLVNTQHPTQQTIIQMYFTKALFPSKIITTVVIEGATVQHLRSKCQLSFHSWAFIGWESKKQDRNKVEHPLKRVNTSVEKQFHSDSLYGWVFLLNWLLNGSFSEHQPAPPKWLIVDIGSLCDDCDSEFSGSHSEFWSSMI